MFNRYRLLVLALLLLPCATSSIDNNHFYRAPFFPDEPRFDNDWLMSGEILMGNTETSTGFNRCGRKVPIFAIYGPENLKSLGIVINGLDSAFFKGTFNLFETQITGYMNFSHGLFFHIHVPIRKVTIDDISLERSREKAGAQEWRYLAQQLDSILVRHGIFPADTTIYKETGAGDLSLLLGWSHACYSTSTLDFIDSSIQTGVLLPTSKQRNLHYAFTIPLGYDGHTAIPLIFDVAVGAFSWLNAGFHAKGLFFFDATRSIRYSTELDPSGFIRLNCARTRVQRHPLVSTGLYVKADHFFHGLSFLLGYLYDKQGRDIIPALRQETANDPLFAGWQMHTLHVIVEYDCATYDYPSAPVISFMYDHVLGGKNIFDGSMKVGTLGASFDWKY